MGLLLGVSRETCNWGGGVKPPLLLELGGSASLDVAGSVSIKLE